MMRIILLVGAFSASIACASGGKSVAGVRHDSELIAEQEVTSSNGTTAYEVISRTRPAFLKSRGTLTTRMTTRDHAMVYVNGVQYGDITSLRNITADQIREIRYYNARDAINKFGTQIGTGVIEITTK
jgi:hypothetical protein